MTTLWPVIYVYFDVFVLAAARLPAPRLRRPGRCAIWLSAWGCSPLRRRGSSPALPRSILALPRRSTWARIGAIRIDRGLDRDERALDGERTFASVAADGVVVLRLPRASRSSTSIHLIVRGSAGAGAQRVAAWLNGHWLGQSVLKTEWEEVVFQAPGRAWFYGVNSVELRFTSTLASGQADASGPPVRVVRPSTW